MFPRKNVYKSIDKERDCQDLKHGTLDYHSHSVAEWILIIEKEIQEAKLAWIENGSGEALNEILQVAATCVACLENHPLYLADTIYDDQDDNEQYQMNVDDIQSP